jgi:diacylglycerol kinase family enzyme
MPFNLDGDPLGDTPVSFEVVAGGLLAVVGPDYSAAGTPIPA